MKAYEVPVTRFTEVASPELLRQLETHSHSFVKVLLIVIFKQVDLKKPYSSA